MEDNKKVETKVSDQKTATEPKTTSIKHGMKIKSGRLRDDQIIWGT